MFLTKKHISRRTMLQGAGAAFALPLLDAMIPAGTAPCNIVRREMCFLVRNMIFVPPAGLTWRSKRLVRWFPSAAAQPAPRRGDGTRRCSPHP
ncbi:hypothetical protein EON77_09000 [bacterium]|nr:MAG: hypothetical protein EON77_09000 [bacterium]